MKKVFVLLCVVSLLTATLCSCGSACEHCGKSTLAYNLVGDSDNGIKVCNSCIEKMTMGKLSFTFTCDGCHEEIVGKENEVEVDGETKCYCNTCFKDMK